MSDKIKRLSDAIRYGSTFLDESISFFGGENERGEPTCGCAIGIAYMAVIERSPKIPLTADSIIVPVSERFGVPRDIVSEVSAEHFRGRMNRAQCADWLASKGY